MYIQCTHVYPTFLVEINMIMYVYINTDSPVPCLFFQCIWWDLIGSLMVHWLVAWGWWFGDDPFEFLSKLYHALSVEVCSSLVASHHSVIPAGFISQRPKVPALNFQSLLLHCLHQHFSPLLLHLNWSHFGNQTSSSHDAGHLILQLRFMVSRQLFGKTFSAINASAGWFFRQLSWGYAWMNEL